MGRLSHLPTRTELSALIVLIATAHFVGAQAPARMDTSGTIVGIVAMKDGGLPLAYSVASIAALGRERFSNDQGVFVLSDLPAGQVLVRVRHLGYSPVDLSIAVHAGRVDTVHVALTHIAVRLTAMEVRAYGPCTNPGVPHTGADSAFATVFEQLRQNAEQYRLLTATYPFVSSSERTMSNLFANGESKIESIDTISVDSRTGWVYKPGTVVMNQGSRRIGGARMFMNIPTLVHFADRTFLENHCFYNGGLEVVDGTELLRIDFTAAARINDPDVNGSMYLDPSNFQIRRSILRLTRIPRELTGLRETEATTYFGELLASVPVIAGIESVNRMDARPSVRNAIAEANEQQRLLQVHFLKGMPGADVRKP